MSDIFNMADTWNNGATTFTAIKMNVTDSASAAASLLMDLQIGGVPVFSVGKAAILVPQGTTTVPGLGFQGGISHYGLSYNGGALHALANNAIITTFGPGIMHGNNGANAIGGFKASVDVRTAGAVFTNTNYMSFQTNEGATAKVSHTLPTAAAGGIFSFLVQDSDGIRINAAAGDTIRVRTKVTSVAGFIESVTLGSIVKLVAINATEWFAMEIGGNWTDSVFVFNDGSLVTP